MGKRSLVGNSLVDELVHSEAEPAASGELRLHGEGEPAASAAAPAIAPTSGHVAGPTPSIQHVTRDNAPAAADDRTTIGLGELVVFTASTHGTWDANASKTGAPRNAAGRRFAWTAPGTPGTATVTFRGSDGASRTTTFQVVAPTGVAFVLQRRHQYPAGVAGAGMTTRVRLLPYEVSFSALSWKEEPADASNLTGIFRTRGAVPHGTAQGAGRWVPVGGGVEDLAQFYGFAQPWDRGSFQWVIPNLYRVSGESGQQRFTTTVQTVLVEGGPHAGRTTVKKSDPSRGDAGSAIAVREPGASSTERQRRHSARARGEGIATGAAAPVVTAAVGSAVASTPRVLVEDDAVPLAGEVRKRELIARVEPAIKAAAGDELGPMWSTAACPYIAHYIAVYSKRPAADVERFIRRYTGSKAQDIDALIGDLVTKVRTGVRYWKQTRQLPPDVAAADPEAAKTAQAYAGANGEAAGAGSVAEVVDSLGQGAPLDAGTEARMGRAFGQAFTDVRIHADAAGSAVASAHGAQALAIGNHVAFASGAYQPGTLEGDALLAHELAHVLQQRDATPSPHRPADARASYDAHEADAEQATGMALASLQGASERAQVKTSANDFQLQRCVGVAHAPGIDRGFHQDRYTWEGDTFEVTLKTTESSVTKGRFFLEVDIRHTGEGDTDGQDPSFALSFPMGKVPKPTVKLDQPAAWSRLDVDMFGDASHVATITHSVSLIDGWNPKSREHTFFGRTPTQMGRTNAKVIVKSPGAVPGTASNSALVTATSDTKALRVDAAAISTKKWLDELLGDPFNGLDAKSAPWLGLKQTVDSKAALSTATGGHEDDALRLTRVGEAITYTRPMFKALGLGSKREAYLPDIADRALAMVSDVQTRFARAVAGSWEGAVDQQLTEAQQAFNTLWYRVTSLYLERGRGADGMLGAAQVTANNVRMLRGADRGAIYYPRLEAMLHVPGSDEEPDAIGAKAYEEWAAVRADFTAGKPGVLARVTKGVEDAQTAMGLAALLCTVEVFHSFKRELDGMVGKVADTLGRDLSKVCQDHAIELETLASGVEAKLKGGSDIKTASAGVVAKFQSIASSATFKADVAAVQSRIKTVKTIETLGKVLAVIGVAALTAGAAGAAVGGALEGAGASALVVGAGEFAAEVVVFTFASRLGNQVVMGGNSTSVGEDLVTNALMFGFLKAAMAGYGRVFKVFGDPKTHKAAFAAGGAVTGMVALQAFAEVHYRLKEGKFMDGDERLRGVISNAVILVALGLGSYLAKPLNQRIKNDMLVFTAKNTPGRLEAVEAKIAGIKAEVDALKGKQGPGTADRAAELLKKIEALWNEEVAVLAEAAKSEKQKKAEATKAFQDTVDGFVKEIAKLDLELSVAGLEADLGAAKAGNMFRPLSPGFVAFRPEGLEVLKAFYKELGGKFEAVPGKEGMYSGKANGEEIFFVAESKAESVFDTPSTKPPTEAQAAANHAESVKARQLNLERSKQLEEQVLKAAENGHVKKKVHRIIAGTGLAAAMDANTLPGANKGAKPPPIKSVPDTLGVGTGKETFEKLGDTPIGQHAPGLDSAGWAEGAQPRNFTANHGNYASATTIADATALTQYRSGVPILDGSVVEVSVKSDKPGAPKPEGDWVVPDAAVRVKVKLTSGAEVYLYGDAADVATGLGPPNKLESKQIHPDAKTSENYAKTLEGDGRLVYGDQVGAQKGGEILVSGGSATAAWNAKVARMKGAVVRWIARGNDKAPTGDGAAAQEYALLEQKLKAPGLDAAEAVKIHARMAELRAFAAAMLPRNVQAADAAFNDAGIVRSVDEIASVTPTEHVPGEKPGRVKVTFKSGESVIVDQVVASHSANLAAPVETGKAGALTLAQGLEMRPVVVNGQVVALESVNPPGAVRVVGAAMWSPAWLKAIADPGARAKYEFALSKQAAAAPRDSPANPLIYNVGKQVPAANTVVK